MFVAEGTSKVVSNPLSGQESLEALKYGFKSRDFIEEKGSFILQTLQR